MNVYFFLLFHIIDLSPSFLPFTVGSQYILLYFTLHSLHFFLYFVTILNHLCSILITSVLNSASDRLAISSLLSCIFVALICSFHLGHNFFVLEQLLRSKGRSNPLGCVLVQSAGEGSAGLLPAFNHSSHSPQANWTLLVVIPGGWFCVDSRTPVVLSNKLSCEAGSFSHHHNSQSFFVRSFEALFPHTGTLGCAVCLAPQLFLRGYLQADVGLAGLLAGPRPVLQPPPCCVTSVPLLPI